MDGVSTAFAAVSLTFQLVGTVKKTRKFLKEVQNAPKQITRLVDTLSRFESMLVAAQGIVEQQKNMKDLPCSINVISDALQLCKSTVEKLDTSVDALKAYFKDHRGGRKTWASFKTVMKQDEVEQIHEQVKEAMRNFQCALGVNANYLQ